MANTEERQTFRIEKYLILFDWPRAEGTRFRKIPTQRSEHQVSLHKQAKLETFSS